MATFYVSLNGSDANNGQGPDASHASNKPWRTIAKALGAAGIASGDTVYIAPGVYREIVTVAMTSAVAETFVIGDIENGQGFKDGSGVLLTPGEVRHSGYLTNDVSAPSASILLSLATRDNLTFQQITFHGGTGTPNCVDIPSGSTAIKLTDCNLVNASLTAPLINVAVAADTAVNLILDRCLLVGGSTSGALNVVAATSTVADYDMGIEVRNCKFYGGSRSVNVSASGANSFKAGGLKFYNSLSFCPSNAGINVATNIATSIPCLAYNNVFYGFGTALAAATLGQITEDYNLIWAATQRTNVNVGSNSKTNNNTAFLFEVGQAHQQGRLPRVFMTPTFDSPALGFGNQSVGITTDFRSRPRPAGGSSTLNAVGPLERHDTAVKSSAANADGGTGVALELTGPADQEILIPVDAVSTTLSIKVKWDSTHADTNKPQAILLATSEIGVATQTVTAAGTAGSAYETLTFAAFTPNAKGWVTLRLRSRSAGGSGKCWYDTLGVA